MITDKQLIHRQYLQSPVWRTKRLEALAHYGAICGRCGCHGTDVHHRTYARVGGSERMEDLEGLCRSCHEAHHQAERCSRAARGMKWKRKKKRGINYQAIYQCLTGAQKEIICRQFGITSGDLYVRLREPKDTEERKIALRMLGMDRADGVPDVKAHSKRRKRNVVEVNRMNPAFTGRVLPCEIGSGRKRVIPSKVMQRVEKSMAAQLAGVVGQL